MKPVWYWRFVIKLFLLISVMLPLPVWATSPSQVLVVYPTNIEKDGVNDSKQLADYYVQKRGIPASNVLGVQISLGGVAYYYWDDYQKFYNDLVGPIMIRLNKLGPASINVILLVGDIPRQVHSPTSPVALD